MHGQRLSMIIKLEPGSKADMQMRESSITPPNSNHFLMYPYSIHFWREQKVSSCALQLLMCSYYKSILIHEHSRIHTRWSIDAI